MRKEINLRPHHGLCIRHYTGHGYDDAFTENMDRTTNTLKSNPAQEIIICTGADDLCRCCPNQTGGVCESEEKISSYDQKCLALCGLSEGQRLRWDLFQEKISKAILEKYRLEDICEDCRWLPLCTAITIPKI